MLFFRSEDEVRTWCEANSTPVRPMVSREQQWQLADAWYSNRLNPDARRPGPDEMREIFSAIGLTGSFWDPESDDFGA